MAKPITLSPFGEFLKRYGVTKQSCAAQLDITTSYVSMLSRGAATPGLKLASKIAHWSGVISKGLEEFKTDLWLA